MKSQNKIFKESTPQYLCNEDKELTKSKNKNPHKE